MYHYSCALIIHRHRGTLRQKQVGVELCLVLLSSRAGCILDLVQLFFMLAMLHKLHSKSLSSMLILEGIASQLAPYLVHIVVGAFKLLLLQRNSTSPSAKNCFSIAYKVELFHVNFVDKLP